MLLLQIHATIDTQTLHSLAHYSKYSYSQELANDPRNDANLRKIITRDNHCHGFVLRKDTNIFVTLHGTKSMDDLLTDFDLRMTKIQFDTELGKVHKGFFERFEMFKEAMEDCIKDLIEQADNHKIIFTGHSMGGSLAQICALFWKVKNGNADVSVVSFGSPKIFNDAASANFRNHIKPEKFFALKTRNNKKIYDIFTYLYPAAFHQPQCKEMVLDVNFSLEIRELHRIDTYIEALYRTIQPEF